MLVIRHEPDLVEDARVHRFLMVQSSEGVKSRLYFETDEATVDRRDIDSSLCLTQCEFMDHARWPVARDIGGEASVHGGSEVSDSDALRDRMAEEMAAAGVAW